MDYDVNDGCEEFDDSYDHLERDCDERYEPEYDDEPGDGMTDVEADADTLASAGWGTDEDYGDFGGNDDY